MVAWLCIGFDAELWGFGTWALLESSWDFVTSHTWAYNSTDQMNKGRRPRCSYYSTRNPDPETQGLAEARFVAC